MLAEATTVSKALAPDGMSDWPLFLTQQLAALAGFLLFPLAIYLLLSGLDDLFIDVLWLRRLRSPAPPAPSPCPEKRIAVVIPLWHEHEVIGRMIDHNLAAIKYSNYVVFIGVYPNDPATQDAVRELEQRHRRVHLAMVPHDGPTVKADCLNWVYQRLLLFEEEEGDHFDLVVMHDAEDLVHPDAFDLMNRHLAECDMVQMPVLPLPTPLRELTHGLYCDDFAEGQGKDLPTRVSLGAFMPGCGVGTGFRREALESLAAAEGNRIFHPSCLTEDYENGLRLHELGFSQRFIPLEFRDGALVATREYFPRRRAQAVRQRARWITGNALQGWQRHGWTVAAPGRSLRNLYYLWRDRKGLWGNPVSLVANLLLVYSIATGFRSLPATPLLRALLWVNMMLYLERIVTRMIVVAGIYGWRFSLGVPVRMMWGNLINCSATLRAVHRFGRSILLREPLAWSKTEHAYPSRSALMEHKRRIGEILVGSGYLEAAQLAAALQNRPAGQRLGEYLVAAGVITEDDLYEALSLQQNLPCLDLQPGQIPSNVARALPGQIQREMQVLPFRIFDRRLYVAGPAIPSDEMQRTLGQFTTFEIRFHLMTPSRYFALAETLLG